ncbi:MAG TPA: hypothetical protein VGQ29_13970 [Gemmatimonadales bacterium]|nr:hypothetical protein [Gemmatimonadales bacterium]
MRRARLRVLGVGVAALLATTCEVQPSAPRVDVNAPEPAFGGARVARVLAPKKLGFSHPTGLAYSAKAGKLLVIPRLPDAAPGPETDVELIPLVGDAKGAVRIAATVTDPINVAFDDKAGRLLLLDSPSNRLFEISARPDGSLNPKTLRSNSALSLRLKDPRGLTVDPATGRLFILDAAGPRILRVTPDARLGFADPTVSAIDLASTGRSNLRGIAFDPRLRRLFVLDPTARVLHELTETGRLVETRDLSKLALFDPRGMSFGPSSDATDDPAETSLYIADRSNGPSVVPDGRITELSFDVPGATGGGAGGVLAPTATAAPQVLATLVKTVLTSNFSPPSPDPSGIDYLAYTGQLLISDGEVEEMTIYRGANLFEMNLAGSLVSTSTTLPWSTEPTGVGSDPDTRKVYFSDDDARKVFEVATGPDDRYGTADDIVRSFGTLAFGSDDPEGITYDVAQDVLFIADGVNAQVYRVSPGANRIFDGVPPAGDDQVTSFDTQSQGLTDPEGITFDTESGGLYVVGKPNGLAFHFSTTGTLLRTIDISGPHPDNPAGLAYVPSSVNADGSRRLWIVTRGVDNDYDPNENDGKAYEFILPLLSGNSMPTVTITAPANGSQSTQSSPVTFTGTATDPESGNLTASLQWTSSRDGTIGSGGSFTTTTLSAGTHTITASVTDGGGLQGSASITLTVNVSGSNTVEARVSAGTDDAEEFVGTLSMYVNSSDLELVNDGTDQVVGMRFNAITIPRGATITNAYVQFTVDETGSTVTSLTLQGQATGNAATFTSATGNISSRARTVNSVAWSPPAWPTVDVAGLDQRTPNIASIIQEIVGGSGWASGNSLAIIVTGTGRRTAEAFEGVPAAAALLHVDYVVPTANSAPTASNVNITGTPQVDQVLTGNYTYGDVDGDAEGTSTYRWLRGSTPISAATARTYTLVSADQGTLIQFEVTPVAASGASPGSAVLSPAVGPVGGTNVAPSASNVSITGDPVAGHVLTGQYTYADADGDAEGTSLYRWLRNGSDISGASGRTYTLVAADVGTMISFRVTPVAAVGTSPGVAVTSPAVGPVTVEPLVVTAIEPNSMATGTTISVTITGSGFIPGAKVTFVNGSGGPTPKASNVLVVNSSRITATVKVNHEKSGPARVWDVRVTNSNGAQATLVDGFTIIR